MEKQELKNLKDLKIRLDLKKESAQADLDDLVEKHSNKSVEDLEKEIDLLDSKIVEVLKEISKEDFEAAGLDFTIIQNLKEEYKIE